MQILRLELNIQSVIAARTQASAHVDGRILLVWAGKAWRYDTWTRRVVAIRKSGKRRGIAEISLTTAYLVDIFDIIEVDSVGSRITYIQNGIPCQLPLQIQAPELCRGGVDRRVRHA